MKLYAGIDLLPTTAWLRSSTSKIEWCCKRDFPTLYSRSCWHWRASNSTCSGWWSSRPTTGIGWSTGLMEAGYAVHLANTAAIVQYEGLKYSADEHDARWLAHLLR